MYNGLHLGSPLEDAPGHVLRVRNSPGAEPRSSKPWELTSNSMWSWSFLQVAAKVSEVPNSKYHSLFFILDHEAER